MTNEELRRLCELLRKDYEQVSTVYNLTTEALRLLDENEAMRGALEYADKTHWFDPKVNDNACLGCDMNQGNIPEHDSWCAIQKIHDALDKLGERT